MSNCIRKCPTALIAFILIVTPISPMWAASVEVPLSHEKSCLKPGSQPVSENLKTDAPSGPFSGMEALKSFYTAVKSGLKAIVNHPTRTLMLGLAMLPSANAFSVSNLNQTTYYSFRAGTATAFLPIIISNASSSDHFNVVIRQENTTEGNITCTGRAPISPSYTDGIWNVSGLANEVNALALQLFFSNDYNANAGIFLYPQITDVTTGQSASGQINLYPTVLAASNLPQFKNFTRNGRGVGLDPIVIRSAGNNMASVRFFILKEAGDLSFQSNGLNISMINNSSSGIYSLVYSIPLSPVSQVNSLLANLQYSAAPDYSKDISIGISIDDNFAPIYNLIVLTCTNPISTQTTISSTGMPASTKTPASATTGISFNSVTPSSILTTLVNSITSKNSALYSDQTSTMPSSSGSNVDVTSTNPVTSNNLFVPLTSPTNTQLIQIIGGSVVGGLLVMGSMVFVVVAFVRNSHGKRIKLASLQKDNQNLENQGPQSNAPTYDIVPNGPYSSVPNKAPDARYDACVSPLTLSDNPSSSPKSPYEACSDPMPSFEASNNVPPVDYGRVNVHHGGQYNSVKVSPYDGWNAPLT